MQQLIAEFLRHLANERRLSTHTCRAYRTDLERFVSFLQVRRGVAQPDVRSVAREDIRAFLGNLSGAGFGRRSIARKLASLRTFFAWLCRLNHLKKNPALQVRPPRQEKTLPVHLDLSEVRRVLENPSPDTALGLRDRAILELFYSSGIRLRELADIRLDGLDPGQRDRACDRKGRQGAARACGCACTGSPAQVPRPPVRTAASRCARGGPAAFFPHPYRQGFEPQRCSGPGRGASRKGDGQGPSGAAYPAAYVCNPSSGPGRRSECGEGNARARESVHHSDLYPRERGTVKEGLSAGASESLMSR